MGKVMVNNFFKVFDKKRFMLVSEIIFVFGAMVLIINIIGRTYTRYESRVDVFAQANIAFFVVDQGTYENSISLNELIPSNTSKYYLTRMGSVLITSDGENINVEQ